MSKLKICFRNTLISTLFFAIPAMAAEFVPYPGKRPVRLMDIKAPDLVQVNFDTDMAGFFRTIDIRIPDIAIPKNSPDADPCERELAQKALEFTRSYLGSAKDIYVKDMRMKTSADEEALSPILTDHGSLGDKLIEKGFARPKTVASEVPWCESDSAVG